MNSHVDLSFRDFMGSMRMFLLITLVSVSPGFQGCAQLCGDTGTREGAWGLVFRCSTGSRMQIDNAESGRTRISGIREQSGPDD
jgi:hypothetical protein